METTTMNDTTERDLSSIPDDTDMGIPGNDEAPIERALAVCLERMRRLAANADTDDFDENWSREVLERRPLIVVAAVLPGQTWTWLMEPEDGAEHDGVLYAAVSHFARPDGTPHDIGCARVELKTMPMEAILHGVSWLVKGLTGEFLTD
jgi:hypothetical protein